MTSLLLFVFSNLLFNPICGSGQVTVKFAAIGDYGKAGPNELAVSNLVKGWNPDFIITLGDNNYENGSAATIDSNIGQYYHQFIYPYTGNFGEGDTGSFNKFFPSLGNHDWYTTNAAPYLNYFTLPGNERYYDFIKGNIHFYSIDSDINEPDGSDSNSAQAQWLKNKLAQSRQEWNIVYFHHPPYSSGQHGSQQYMQWPFKTWGATTVLSGHDHTYERITINGFTYFVNGLGGKSIYSFGTPLAGSQVRYNNNYGAMLINSYDDSLAFKFYSVSGNIRDSYKILPSVKSLILTLHMEGFYNPVTNTMVGDTIQVYLRNNISPYIVVDSAKGYLNSSGNGSFNFSRVNNATDYYLIIKHRNSIETWSAMGNRFIANVLIYNFTTSSSQAYGNNLILKGTKYNIYSGDVNQDGVVDASDLSMVDNDAFNSLSGYVNTDLNGDAIVDAGDLSIADNNVLSGVTVVTPLSDNGVYTSKNE